MRYEQRRLRVLRAINMAAVAGEGTCTLVTGRQIARAWDSVRKPTYDAEGRPAFDAHVAELQEEGRVQLERDVAISAPSHPSLQ